MNLLASRVGCEGLAHSGFLLNGISPVAIYVDMDRPCRPRDSGSSGSRAGPIPKAHGCQPVPKVGSVECGFFFQPCCCWLGWPLQRAFLDLIAVCSPQGPLVYEKARAPVSSRVTPGSLKHLTWPVYYLVVIFFPPTLIVLTLLLIPGFLLSHSSEKLGVIG